MKSVILLTVLLVFSASLRAQREVPLQVKGNPYLLPAQLDYDVNYYNLDLQVDPAAGFISGFTEVKGTIVSDNTDEIVLNFYQHLTIDSVTSTSQQLTYSQGDNILTINLPQTLNSGDIFDVFIYYRGYPMQSGTPGYGLIFTTYNNQELVYSYNWPYFASTFIPCKDHPSDKADSLRIAVTVPDNFTVAANGLLRSEISLPGNLKKFVWKSSYPIVPYNIFLSIYPFQVYQGNYLSSLSGNISLTYYLFPNHFTAGTAQLETVVPLILQAYEGTYGPFPFSGEKYGICESVISGGMEHQTILTMNYPSFFSDIVVHESAHEYFGNMISISDWGHIWLSEGFATYSEAIYKEYHQGAAAYAQEIAADMAGSGEGAIFVYDPSTPANIIPYSLVYLKAAVVLHMLRYIMGDSLFFQMLHDYVTVSSFRYGNVNTEQFESFCENYYSGDLHWFFDQWIYREGKMAAEYYYFWKEPGNELRLKIHSIPSSPSGTTYHSMPVPIRISAAGQQVPDTLWIDSVGVNRNYLFADTASLQIQFDPDNRILKGPFTRLLYPDIDRLYLWQDSIHVEWQPFFDFTDYRISVYRKENSAWQLLLTDSTTGLHYVYSPSATGTYGFALAARQDGHLTRFSPIKEIVFTTFPLNQGILLVDETRNGTGTNMLNPTDQVVDEFYDFLLNGWNYQQFDVYQEGRAPTVLEIAPYSLIIWHHEVPFSSYLSQAQTALQNYLNAGGKIIFSGMKLLNSLDQNFLRDYLGVENLQIISEADFVGAQGDVFPTLPVDTSKITVPFYNQMLPNSMIFDTTHSAKTVYRYLSGSANPLYQDKPCGSLANSPADTMQPAVLALGFPLYFVEKDSARAFMEDALQELNPVVNISRKKLSVTHSFKLIGCYPNPFNPNTTIVFELNRSELIHLQIFNILGQRVRNLFTGPLTAGVYRMEWDGKNDGGEPVGSGMYFVRLRSKRFHRSMKMILER